MGPRIDNIFISFLLMIFNIILKTATGVKTFSIIMKKLVFLLFDFLIFIATYDAGEFIRHLFV